MNAALSRDLQGKERDPRRTRPLASSLSRRVCSWRLSCLVLMKAEKASAACFSASVGNWTSPRIYQIRGQSLAADKLSQQTRNSQAEEGGVWCGKGGGGGACVHELTLKQMSLPLMVSTRLHSSIGVAEITSNLLSERKAAEITRKGRSKVLQVNEWSIRGQLRVN